MDAQETKIFIAIISAIIVIAAVVIYFAISMIRQQKVVLALQKDYANAEINALEKDRSRIASDLHDDLAPMLSAVKMKMSSFSLEDEDDLEQQQSCNQIISELSKRMREISFDLMPSTLLKKGLFTAVEEFIERIDNDEKLHIELHVPQLKEHRLNREQEIHIYRIMQELVHNTIKHANAQKLSIKFETQEKMLIIRTSDDGKGFDYSSASTEKNGLGLGSVMNRVDLLNGQLDVLSEKGKGTKYNIEIPL